MKPTNTIPSERTLIKMVKHIVMFRFAENAEGRTKAENLEIAKQMLEKLQGVVPTLKASNVNINGGSNPSNYDLVLEADYDSYEALSEYIVHPAHKAVGEFMKKVRIDRACVDYEY